MRIVAASSDDGEFGGRPLFEMADAIAGLSATLVWMAAVFIVDRGMRGGT